MSNIATKCVHLRIAQSSRCAGARYLSSNAPRRQQTEQPFPLPRSSKRRPFATIALASILALGAYTLGSIYPPTPLSVLFPRPAPPPPNSDSPESRTYTENLETQLQNLPFLQEHRSKEDANEWYEARPYQNFPEERRVNNLSAGALRGPGKLALPPLVRSRKDESESIIVVHLGRGLCGHDGIVHGGLLATLLDESLGRMAINNLPEKVGVTAKLALNYKAPTRADQFVIIRTSLIETKGRKAIVKGHVEDLNGTLLVEATATFVQPRYAKLLNSAHLRQAMGEPPKSDEPLHLADGENVSKLGVHIDGKKE
ncbi:HotDog domain-containing protein [Crucibulum laeve]|uniref:HotDog domain-containing protein n=1 Tax=Crucibulum laeve TaxID=68775 RepID=A0A5C3M0V2_9AGAR|nr:HotDog domain-containing protein [Crucibulum laeve]